MGAGSGGARFWRSPEPIAGADTAGGQVTCVSRVVMAPAQYQQISVSQQEPEPEGGNSQEISELLGGLRGGKGGSAGGASRLTPEEIVEKFQRVLQDRKQDQRRLEEVQAKLSKLEQMNMDLAIENHQLRSKTMTGQVILPGGSQPRYVQRPMTPHGVRQTVYAGSVSQVMSSDVPRQISSGQCAYVAPVQRPLASSSAVIPSSSSVARARSESPGPRAAWAATVVPGSGVVKTPSGTPPQSIMSPQITRRVTPIRQVTPPLEREYTPRGSPPHAVAASIGPPVVVSVRQSLPTSAAPSLGPPSSGSVSLAPGPVLIAGQGYREFTSGTSFSTVVMQRD